MTSSQHGARVDLGNLTKRFHDGEAAVLDVNLNIKAGCFMTFLGPSGSGKTTTLNMIAGFIRQTVGSVRIDSKDVSDLPPNKRQLGMVFQHYALFPHLSVFENIAYPLRRRRMSEDQIKMKVGNTIKRVHLEGFEKKHPQQLSGGQQQRVAVARAIVYEPPVLLMDEPLGALDRKLREELQLELSRLHRDVGSTFIYVTHDQEEALALSDQIAVFRDGRIEQVGTPEALYSDPANLFVARFLGESNIIHGQRRSGAFVSRHDQVLEVQSAGLPGETEIALLVRPESMRLSGKNGTASGNGLAATVTDIVYLGSSRKIILKTLQGGDDLIAREVSGQYSNIERGAEVFVGWSPNDAKLIRAA
jgi:putative spermidine/putrescine transport system ATP-binding protein